MPDTDVVLMMRPSTVLPAFTWSRQEAAAQRDGAKVPLRWTLMTASHSSSVMFVSMRSRRMPALLTRAWRSPNVSTAVLMRRCAPSHDEMSSPLATASPPIPLISWTTCSAGLRSPPVPSTFPPRSLTTTLAPCLANDRACSRPMPRPAPVTMAIRPSHSPLMADHLACRPSRRRNGRSVTWPTVMEADVVVVGGGPAGAAAAIALARLGREVIVVDKARFPRDKCCGDGLTTGALRLLEGLGLEPAAGESWQQVDDVIVRSPSGHEVVFPLPRDDGVFAAAARRFDFDSALLDVARGCGVKVLDGHALVGARNEPDRVVLDIDGAGPLHARYAVGADGMWSPLRKALGVATPGYLGEWHAFRQYFTGVKGPAARDL